MCTINPIRNYMTHSGR